MRCTELPCLLEEHIHMYLHTSYHAINQVHPHYYCSRVFLSTFRSIITATIAYTARVGGGHGKQRSAGPQRVRGGRQHNCHRYFEALHLLYPDLLSITA